MFLRKLSYFAALCMLAALPLAGCGGSSSGGSKAPGGGEGGGVSDDNVNITKVEQYDDATAADTAFDGAVTAVSISDGKPTVKFAVVKPGAAKASEGATVSGSGIAGIPASKFAFYFAQLKADKSSWVNYRLITKAEGAANARNAGRIGLPTNFGAGDVNFVDNGDGTYSFTFKEALESYSKIEEGKFAGNTQGTVDVKEVKYDANLIHRAAVVFNPGKPENVQMLTFDFIPATGEKYVNPNDPAGKSNLARDIANMKSCDACHGENGGIGYNQTGGRAGHFAGRPDVKICVLCHTEQNVIEGRISAEFTNLIHTIHMAKALPVPVTDIAGIDASHITYPQDVRTCGSCHSGFDSIGQKGLTPSPNSCNSCHNDGSKSYHIVKNAGCTECHAPGFGKSHAVQKNAEPVKAANNNFPAGTPVITYDVKKVTVDATGKPQITFAIKKDGVAQDLESFFAEFTPYRGTGVTQQADPRVYFAWNNSSASADYDGKKFVAIQTADSIVKGDDNYYTLTDSAALPDGATMLTGIVMGAYKTASGIVVTPVGGVGKASDKVGSVQFEKRRDSVTDAKCNACHGTLLVNKNHVSASRGGMVFEACAVCHVGRGDLAFDSKFPETPDGLRKLSSNPSALGHTIHGGSKRSKADTKYGATFPGTLTSCETCHVANGYDYSSAEAQKALGRMNGITTEGGRYPKHVFLHGSTPITHACAGCHDDGAAIRHMEQNGGIFEMTGGNIAGDDDERHSAKELVDAALANAYESCLLCHGAGKIAAIKAVHSK
ncbi:MAG: OmcA/MtrC family decaheme c-type cytochrome [Trichlorobacter sp.]|nr:OmcA/MtrC family decaheme c-type cytochrome [Trichlorobacter sp.]